MKKTFFSKTLSVILTIATILASLSVAMLSVNAVDTPTAFGSVEQYASGNWDVLSWKFYEDSGYFAIVKSTEDAFISSEIAKLSAERKENGHDPVAVVGDYTIRDRNVNIYPWSDYTNAIKTVSFCEGMLNIPANAFCRNVTGISSTYYTALTGTVRIPASVETIGDNAFYMTGINKLVFTSGSKLETIGAAAFASTAIAGTLSLPSTVKTIGENAFASCSGITGTLAFSNTVTYIGAQAFKECTGLSGITFGKSIQTIGEKAFNGCNIKSEDNYVTIELPAYVYTDDVADKFAPNPVKKKDYDESHTHQVVSFVPVAPTCTESGLRGGTFCWICGETISEQLPVSPVGHDYSVEMVLSAPTCQDYGRSLLSCSICGASIDSYTPKLNHSTDPASAFAKTQKVVIENRKSATCTTYSSYDTVIYCSICGIEMSRETTTGTTLTSHKIVVSKAAVKPTCAEPGYTEEQSCKVCGEIFVESTVIEATGKHSRYVSKVAVEPTCVEAGCTAEYSCSVCNQVIVASTVVPATGVHIPGAASDENEVESSCTVPGSKDIVLRCIICNEILDTKTENLPYAEHNLYESKAAVAATCKTKGSTAEYSCKSCKQVIIAAKETEALNHSLETVEGKPATCTETGYYTYQQCQRCSYSTYRVIPVKAHTWEKVSGTPATQTTGYTDYSRCTVCGAEKDKEVIPVITGNNTATENDTCEAGHTWADVQGTPASCTTDGVSDYRVCTVCGETTGKTAVAAIGHADNNADGDCDNCGETIGEKTEKKSSFLDTIRAFFANIASFFRSLFGGK